MAMCCEKGHRGRVCAEWMVAPADVNQAYHVDLSLIVKNRE